MAPLIVNLDEVLAYFVERLEHQVAITGDEEMAALLDELPGYPESKREHDPSEAAARGILMPLRVRAPDGGELSFFGTVATFGTAVEVTTSELSIESLVSRRRGDCRGAQEPRSAHELGAVVELLDADRAVRRGVEAELAQHALVEVLLDDLEA